MYLVQLRLVATPKPQNPIIQFIYSKFDKMINHSKTEINLPAPAFSPLQNLRYIN